MLTLVELSGLLLVIFIGLCAIDRRQRRLLAGRRCSTPPEDKSVFFAVTAATSLAFFAMVGFEDSVNMAEETKDPSRIFPKMMLTGLGITGVIYVLVSISAVALVPVGELARARDRRCSRSSQAGAPGLPVRHDLPVHHDVRGGQLRADQHADGEPAALRHGQPGRAARASSARCTRPAARRGWRSSFTTLIAVRPDRLRRRSIADGSTRSRSSAAPPSLLLLGVFTVVNVAVLVLRADRSTTTTSARRPCCR